MGVTRSLDGEAGTVMLDPLWVTQRAFVLAWLEVSLESSGSPGDSASDTLPEELVVQLWCKPKPADMFDYVAEVILPAGQKRKIAEQLVTGFGLSLPVVLPAGGQSAVVHNGGVWWPAYSPPTITVTPHGTWA